MSIVRLSYETHSQNKLHDPVAFIVFLPYLQTQVTYKRKPIRVTADISMETLIARRA